MIHLSIVIPSSRHCFIITVSLTSFLQVNLVPIRRSQSTLKQFVTIHNIIINPRFSRFSHKAGKVERNNGVFKTVMDKLQKADTNAGPSVLLAGETFLTNLIRGGKCINAFQLARRFYPKILGFSKQLVTQTLLDAYIERETTRALERLMKVRMPNTIDPKLLISGTRILFL